MTDGPAPGVPRDRPAAAFFDVDNTLLRGASMYHVARALFRRDFLTFGDIARLGWRQTRYRLRGENLLHMHRAQEEALAFVRGHRSADLRAVGEEAWREIMCEKLWPGTLALARRHLAAGEQVWLVTATPLEIAVVISEALGFTGALGTVAEQLDGVYTGRLVGERLHGPAKAAAVADLAVREGLYLPDCSAYSDSQHDLPMLSLVGHPCAVNPDAALRTRARELGWPVCDFRASRRAARATVPWAVAAGAIAGGAAAVARRSGRRRDG